jgi:hypothetical protein
MGNHAAQLDLTTPGNKWLFLCKAFSRGGPGQNGLDTIFMDDLVPGLDTIYYYLWIPNNAPIDSIFAFERDSLMEWDSKVIFRKADLNFGYWNELKSGLSLTADSSGTQVPIHLPLWQIDFEIHTDSAFAHPGLSPGCTLYWDCPSTMGSILSFIGDTAGQKDTLHPGIEMPEQGDGAVIVPKTSINCVAYETTVMAPVMIQLFDVTGRKQLEIAPGVQPAGKYSIPLKDLHAGVYLVRVVAGKEVETGKVISVVK